MKKEIRKKINNRSKNTWRRHISSQEYDNYIEEKLRDERIGSFDAKKDDELFVIDTKPKVCKLFKKIKQLSPPRCFQILQPTSAVQDPIKRNHVRSKEERKHPIRRKIEELKRASGKISKLKIQAQKQSDLAIRKSKLKKKIGLKFNSDAWSEKEPVIDGKIGEWLTLDTVRHTLTNTRNLNVKIPKGICMKKSVIHSIENPHPGTSYNPSYDDHRDLLKKVAEKEMKILKEEAHINRVTTNLFSKLTPLQKENLWVEEMSEGIVKLEEDEKREISNTDNEYKAINPPSDFEKKKTLKQRRKQREQLEQKLLRKQQKVEKNKVADIYKLKIIKNKIEETENRQSLINIKKKEKTALKKIEPKRLGRLKYSEPDMEFTRGCELKGNLRATCPAGNLLADRYYSLQKRNVIVPSKKVTKFSKTKVKRFVKPSHKEDVSRASSLRIKTSKKRKN